MRGNGGQASGALHHIIARGIERKRIFTNGVDRDNFLNRLGNFERKYHLKSNGFNFENVLGQVAELLDLKPEQVLAVGKYKKTVAARSLLCF